MCSLYGQEFVMCSELAQMYQMAVPYFTIHATANKSDEYTRYCCSYYLLTYILHTKCSPSSAARHISHSPKNSNSVPGPPTHTEKNNTECFVTFCHISINTHCCMQRVWSRYGAANKTTQMNSLSSAQPNPYPSDQTFGDKSSLLVHYIVQYLKLKYFIT